MDKAKALIARFRGIDSKAQNISINADKCKVLRGQKYNQWGQRTFVVQTPEGVCFMVALPNDAKLGDKIKRGDGLDLTFRLGKVGDDSPKYPVPLVFTRGVTTVREHRPGEYPVERTQQTSSKPATPAQVLNLGTQENSK
jgi:hypothetical protein